MTDLQQRLQAFVKLGELFRDYCDKTNEFTLSTFVSGSILSELDEKVAHAGHKNGWFTRENVLLSLKAWADELTREKLDSWLSHYDLSKNRSKKVAIIMAGNIPLVGFHDFLAALITGNSVLVKQSSNDTLLLPFLADFLSREQPRLGEMISFTEGILKEYDAVIATGSTNTARYFEYYFGNKPHIIRKNRTSAAILTGNEGPSDLKSLGRDIFTYFGLGCRNVSKLFVPEGYDFTGLYEAVASFERLMDHQKYANNYHYNKAVYLMSDLPILDNGFLILRGDSGYGSPIATLFYEHYNSPEAIREKIGMEREHLQCIVSEGFHKGEIPFGMTQFPGLADYADEVDTVRFLTEIDA